MRVWFTCFVSIVLFKSVSSVRNDDHKKVPVSAPRAPRGGFTKNPPAANRSLFSSTRRDMAISSDSQRIKARGLFRGYERRSTRAHYSTEIEIDGGVVALPRPKSRLVVPYPTINTGASSPSKQSKRTKRANRVKTLDLAIFSVYLCSSIAINLPVLLLPMAAAEQATGRSVSALVVSVASIAIAGGGLGKFVNGFVCQEAGAKFSSCFFLLGGAISSFLFSMSNAGTIGYAYAAIEFFISMQWTALSVVFSNHYKGDTASLAAGITALSLASTCGQLLAKSLGTTLLQTFHWRSVARLGAAVALLGAVIANVFVAERPAYVSSPPRQSFSWDRMGSSIASSGRNVLTNPLFWAVGYAHGMALLARCSDRVLGEFFQSATGLPRSICGGLTLSVTFGLVHGLVSGRAFQKLKDVSLQKAFIQRRYLSSVLSALSLAVVAHPSVSSLIGESKLLMAGILTTISAMMASSMSFQFFQIPNLVSTTSFGDDKAVCLSWLDATAFFMNAPIWAAVGRVVSTLGWSAAFTMIAALFAVGGGVMMRVIPPVLEQRKNM